MAPAELENLVRSLDGVADCAVLGVPHPRAGQVLLLNFMGAYFLSQKLYRIASSSPGIFLSKKLY